MAKKASTSISNITADNLIAILQTRFEKNKHRHPSIKWEQVFQSLQKSPQKCKVILAMEQTGGEPDVIGIEASTKQFIFCDCAVESPTERRSLCYDKAALEERKEFKPASNAMDMAKTIGITLLNEEDYRYLQSLEAFDTKTSSWIETPAAIRKLGGALFCDRRYNHVFTYHNGASSYYAARGFRGKILV